MIGTLISFKLTEEGAYSFGQDPILTSRLASAVIHLKIVRLVSRESTLCKSCFLEGSEERIDDVSFLSTIAFERDDSEGYRWSFQEGFDAES